MAELGPRAVARHARAAAVLAWQAAPAALAGSMSATALAAAGPLAAAWLTSDLLDRLTRGTLPVLDAVLLGATGLAVAAVPHLQRFCTGELDRRLRLSTQDKLFAALDRHVGLSRLEDPRFQDRLQVAGNAGRGAAAQIVGGTLGLGAALSVSFGFVGTLAGLHPLLALLILGAAGPALWLSLVLSRSSARMMLGTSQSHRRQFFFARLLTALDAAKEVRLFGLGGFFRERMLGELGAINSAERRIDLRRVRVELLLAILSGLAAGAGLIWLIGNSYGVGQISLYLLSVAGLQAALSGGVHQLATTHESLLMFDHYAAVTATPAGPSPQSSGPVPALRRGIEFRDVWFRYGPDQPWVLRGLTLTIPYGRSTAIVGLNGAGKSTLVKLLCRFYEPTRGTVEWDGVPLAEADPAALRARIGAVFQDFRDYDLSARENIGLGDLTAGISRIERAAMLAGVHDTLAALPRGYDTALTRMFFVGSTADGGEGEGVLLSGGQWQRVAVARALLRTEADLLILDEPSSGLDAQAEAELHQALRAHRRGRTTVLISHRLGSLSDADAIAVLDQGRVVEHGDHERLMLRDGIYARLFRAQAAGYIGAAQ